MSFTDITREGKNQMKKFLASLLATIMLLGVFSVYLPMEEADAASVYCLNNYQQTTSRSYNTPFKLYYRIVKFPTTTAPADQGSTAKPEPTPAPVPKPEPEQKPTPAPQPKPEPQPAPEQEEKKPVEQGSLNEYELKVVELVNIERQKNGLQALKIDEELSKVARLKSADMRDNNYFSHQPPTYGSPFDMMKKYGISYRTAGENIAAGQKTPEAVVTGWMNSSGHRANILNSNFTHIGVGFVKGGSYGTYWTQQFIGK
jgi:uncharacterized YkwD family protein